MTLDPADTRDFYERAYLGTGVPEDAARGVRWRELGGVIKADHVDRLLERCPVPPQKVIEIGCGDGAVLQELSRRGIGRIRVGIDISQTAVRIASSRPGVDEAWAFDGEHIKAPDEAYDLAICTHVLEHVVEPLALLREITRIARAVVVEVPLERNLSARRPSARALSRGAGHLQRFSRTAVRRLVTEAGWTVHDELLDPLPVAVHTFGAAGRRARAAAGAKSAVRSILASAPVIAERLMTLHYAVLVLPPSAVGW